VHAFVCNFQRLYLPSFLLAFIAVQYYTYSNDFVYCNLTLRLCKLGIDRNETDFIFLIWL
jgi:hypothetical protein